MRLNILRTKGGLQVGPVLCLNMNCNEEKNGEEPQTYLTHAVKEVDHHCYCRVRWTHHHRMATRPRKWSKPRASWAYNCIQSAGGRSLHNNITIRATTVRSHQIEAAKGEPLDKELGTCNSLVCCRMSRFGNIIQ
jgi:hypothetical protein